MAGETQKPVTLGAYELALATDLPSGKQAWQVDHAPSGPEAAGMTPLHETVSWGYSGEGGSVPAARNLHDYSSDINVDDWDTLRPGPLQSKIGLALTNPVVALETARDANGVRYLYIGEDGPTLTKVRLSDFAVMTTKTFTHDTAPRISAIIAPKDGSAPRPAGDTTAVTQPGNALVVIGFGNTAPIAQIDTIATASGTADTYGAQNTNKAYGGTFLALNDATNGQVVLWKTSALVSRGTIAGAFCGVSAATIGSATIDLTTYATWRPDATTTTPQLVGNIGSSINTLVEYNRGVLAAKPEGLYEFTAEFSATLVHSTRDYRADDNGKNAIAWGPIVIMPTVQDVQAYPSPSGINATVGYSTLLSTVTNPVAGSVVTATARYGQYLYLAYWDGTDTRIKRALAKRQQDSVPHYLVFHGVTTVPGHRVRTMKCIENGSGTQYLIYGTTSATTGAYDVGYCVLDARPTSGLRSAAGGYLVTTLQGDPNERRTFDLLVVYGKNLNAANYWTVEIKWDEGPWQTVGTIQTNGPTTLAFPRSCSSGFLYQLRFTCTRATGTNWPALWYPSTTAQGVGGALLIGQRAPRYVSYITATVDAEEGQILAGGRRQTVSPRTLLAGLKAYVGTGATAVPQMCANPEHPGAPMYVMVEKVTWTPAARKAGQQEAKRITIRMRELHGATG